MGPYALNPLFVSATSMEAKTVPNHLVAHFSKQCLKKEIPEHGRKLTQG